MNARHTPPRFRAQPMVTSLLLGRLSLIVLTFAACSRKDADDDVARMTSKDPLKSGRVIESLPKDANLAERILHGKSPDCYTCAVHHCRDKMKHCGAISDNAANGPSKGKPRAELCESTLRCVVKNPCVGRGISVKCYCGSALGVDCMTGKADGPCKSELESGLETTDAKSIAMNYTHEDTGGGAAMSLTQCLIEHSCDKKCLM